jgi:hypothetical protein
MLEEMRLISEARRPRPTMILIMSMINIIIGNRKNQSDDVKQYQYLMKNPYTFLNNLMHFDMSTTLSNDKLQLVKDKLKRVFNI